MLEINLLPPELRKKKKSQIFSSGFKLPTEIVIGIGGGVVGILIAVHIFLLVNNISKVTTYKSLQKKWDAIAPSKQNVDTIVNELRSMQKNLQSIKEITEKRNTLWAQKFNIISDLLPKGVWIKKITLTEEMLFIEGSALSKQKMEMLNVHNFANALKESKEFMTGLAGVELGSIQSRMVQNVDVADFTISAKLR